MKIPPSTRQIVLERDMHRCVSCGEYVGPFGDYSIHHRTPRGMGGTKLAESNSPANLLTLHGSGTTGCHGWLESHRRKAEQWGYIVRRGLDPTKVAVYTYQGWTLFDADGGVYLIPRDNRPEQFAQWDRDIEAARLLRSGVKP